MPKASPPESASSSRERPTIASIAVSQSVAASAPSRRTSGRVRRSGESLACQPYMSFGPRRPRLTRLCGRPRTPTIRPSSTAMSIPSPWECSSEADGTQRSGLAPSARWPSGRAGHDSPRPYGLRGPQGSAMRSGVAIDGEFPPLRGRETRKTPCATLTRRMEEPTEPRAFEVGESFARILTETTQSLVCVFDRDGRILLFNEACERATGYRRDEVIGRDARDFVIPPEEREAFGEFLTFVWRTGTPSPQVGHWQTKQGRLRLIAWSNHPMPGPEGSPAALVTTGIDLTDRESPSRGVEGALISDPGEKLAEIGRLATEQRALRRVATLVASEVSPERVFTAVSEGCARVLEVNASTVVRYETDGTATVRGRHNRDNIDVFRVGERIRTDEDSALGRVAATAAPARVDDWGGLAGEIADAMFRTGYRS